jgi:hypothetical protein
VRVIVEDAGFDGFTEYRGATDWITVRPASRWSAHWPWRRSRVRQRPARTGRREGAAVPGVSFQPGLAWARQALRGRVSGTFRVYRFLRSISPVDVKIIAWSIGIPKNVVRSTSTGCCVEVVVIAVLIERT